MPRFLALAVQLVAPAAVFADSDLGYADMFSNNLNEFANQQIEVKGQVPDWLVGGAHVMNGAALWSFPKRRMSHVLDGFSKIHAVEFTSKNTAVYSGQFARSGFYNNAVSKQDVTAGLLFEDTVPPRHVLPLQNALAPNDNINVNVIRINGSVQLISDVVGTVFLNSTMGTDHVDVDGHFPGAKITFTDVPSFPNGMAVTLGSAHPLSMKLSSQQETGEFYGIAAATKATPFQSVKAELLRLFKIDPLMGWKHREEVITLELPRVPYMHSFGFVSPEGTKPGDATRYKYAVLIHHPFYMHLTKEFPLYDLPMEDIFEFVENEPVRFYVVDLGTGKLAYNLTLDGEPFIYSHTLNSYQEGSSIYLDLVGYKMSFFKRSAFDVVLNKTARDASKTAYVFRLVLNLDSGAVELSTVLPGADIELPTTNEYYKGRKYCYAWSYEQNFKRSDSDAAGAAGATGYASMAATKFDLCASAKEQRTVRTSFYKPYHYFHESFFVPRPGATREDDGVIMQPAHDGSTGSMSLYVLDAASMKPLAQAVFPKGAGGLLTHTRFLFDFRGKPAAVAEGEQLVI
eukprot:TRINITY_DN37267_c0_g1_i1.p1 TRINITY_DN37267_c0_g1~~TRINITY_DN37267_c0_g1_i1.p1  ORF type:complete len:571 (-),score=113.81 TRINITY_DN37267_c0_g1_i1:535-2247(-)